MDTGRPLSQGNYWLWTIYSTVTRLVELNRQCSESPKMELIVAHTSSGEEFHAGDEELLKLLNANVSDTAARSVDLGGRTITIFSTPGAARDGRSFHDSRTQWLLTGDLACPALLRVRDWTQLCASLTVLVDFAETHSIEAVLGSRIEMSDRSGKLLSQDAAGHELPLHAGHLRELRELCQAPGSAQQRKAARDFILEPDGIS